MRRICSQPASAAALVPSVSPASAGFLQAHASQPDLRYRGLSIL